MAVSWSEIGGDCWQSHLAAAMRSLINTPLQRGGSPLPVTGENSRNEFAH
jgi:hypothetical protein